MKKPLWFCEKCRKRLVVVYRLNLFFRDPNKKYSGSGLTFIVSRNKVYCGKHYKIIKRKIESII